MFCKWALGSGRAYSIYLHNANVIENAEGPKPDLEGAHWQLLESLLPVLKSVQVIRE